VSTYIMDSRDGSDGMRIVSLSKGVRRPKQSASLGKEATKRLKWFDWHKRNGENVSRTCRHFGISRSTFYRWKGRYDPWRLETLEGRSTRPRRCRRRSWTSEQVTAVLQVRLEHPRWGKAKLRVLLLQQGIRVSESAVGRILSHLREQGLLREGRRPIYARKRRHVRPHATPWSRDLRARMPGDLIQLDTLDVNADTNRHFKHFSMVDVFSRYGLMEIRGRATAVTAKESLERMLERSPFPVKAIQVDGGSEFMAEFEQFCAERKIKLYTLPPRSPKLNGRVERCQRTHTEEFYQCCDASANVASLAQALAKWEAEYNRIRPHQALGYITPEQCLGLHGAGLLKPHPGRCRPEWQLLWQPPVPQTKSPNFISPSVGKA
jgi:putative transposase